MLRGGLTLSIHRCERGGPDSFRRALTGGFVAFRSRKQARSQGSQVGDEDAVAVVLRSPAPLYPCPGCSEGALRGYTTLPCGHSVGGTGGLSNIDRLFTRRTDCVSVPPPYAKQISKYFLKPLDIRFRRHYP